MRNRSIRARRPDIERVPPTPSESTDTPPPVLRLNWLADSPQTRVPFESVLLPVQCGQDGVRAGLLGQQTRVDDQVEIVRVSGPSAEVLQEELGPPVVLLAHQIGGLLVGQARPVGHVRYAGGQGG